MADFATTDDIAASWRPLVGTEIGYAQDLLDAAAFWIRGRKPGIADGDPAARIVSIDVVRAAMRRDRYNGVHSGTHTVDGRTDSWTGVRNASVAELAATLVFTDYHLQLLGLWHPTAVRAQFGNAAPGVDPIRITGWAWDTEI